MSIDFDFRPDHSSCIWDEVYWKEMQNRVIEAKASKSNTLVEFVTEEMVVVTLRTPQTPETIYWMLRYYIESNECKSLINTDRGKSLVIDFDADTDSISVYVGSSDSVFCIGEQNGCKIYTMDVQEKYDFIWYDFLGAALKRHFTAAGISEQAIRENDENESYSPTLFFTTEKNPSCVLRTDWSLSLSEPRTRDQAMPNFQEYVKDILRVFNIRLTGDTPLFRPS